MWVFDVCGMCVQWLGVGLDVLLHQHSNTHMGDYSRHAHTHACTHPCRFRENENGVLVATDVAARGLDIKVCGLVVLCMSVCVMSRHTKHHLLSLAQPTPFTPPPTHVPTHLPTHKHTGCTVCHPLPDPCLG